MDEIEALLHTFEALKSLKRREEALAGQTKALDSAIQAQSTGLAPELRSLTEEQAAANLKQARAMLDEIGKTTLPRLQEELRSLRESLDEEQRQAAHLKQKKGLADEATRSQEENRRIAQIEKAMAEVQGLEQEQGPLLELYRQLQRAQAEQQMHLERLKASEALQETVSLAEKTGMSVEAGVLLQMPIPQITALLDSTGTRLQQAREQVAARHRALQETLRVSEEGVRGLQKRVVDVQKEVARLEVAREAPPFSEDLMKKLIVEGCERRDGEKLPEYLQRLTQLSDLCDHLLKLFAEEDKNRQELKGKT